MADEPVNPKPEDETPGAEAHDSPTHDASPEQMAESALDSAAKAAENLRSEAAPFDLPDIEGNGASTDQAAGLALLSDVALKVKIELGRTRMYVEDVLRLSAESVIELDKAAGDPVDIYVNDRLVARGEVLVLNENFCVRVSEIIDHVDMGDE